MVSVALIGGVEDVQDRALWATRRARSSSRELRGVIGVLGRARGTGSSDWMEAGAGGRGLLLVPRTRQGLRSGLGGHRAGREKDAGGKARPRGMGLPYPGGSTFRVLATAAVGPDFEPWPPPDSQEEKEGENLYGGEEQGGSQALQDWPTRTLILRAGEKRGARQPTVSVQRTGRRRMAMRPKPQPATQSPALGGLAPPYFCQDCSVTSLRVGTGLRIWGVPAGCSWDFSNKTGKCHLICFLEVVDKKESHQQLFQG